MAQFVSTDRRYDEGEKEQKNRSAYLYRSEFHGLLRVRIYNQTIIGDKRREFNKKAARVTSISGTNERL
jgi:hypothetical protein